MFPYRKYIGTSIGKRGLEQLLWFDVQPQHGFRRLTFNAPTTMTLFAMAPESDMPASTASCANTACSATVGLNDVYPIAANVGAGVHRVSSLRKVKRLSGKSRNRGTGVETRITHARINLPHLVVAVIASGGDNQKIIPTITCLLFPIEGIVGPIER